MPNRSVMLTLEQEELDALYRVAMDEDRSFANLVMRILRKWLVENGKEAGGKK